MSSHNTERTSFKRRNTSASAVARFIGECAITAYTAIMASTAILCCGAQPPSHDHGDWCLNHFCMQEATVFTAVGEDMYGLVKQDLERISYATGRFDLTTDPQAGIPVMWQSPIPNLRDKSKSDCGSTQVTGFVYGHGDSLFDASSDAYTQSIAIDRNAKFCSAPGVSLLHELIHALAPKQSHVETDDSLFSVVAHTDYLDEKALTKLCSEFDCLIFNPEEKAPVFQ